MLSPYSALFDRNTAEQQREVLVDLLLIPLVAVDGPRQLNLCAAWTLLDQELKNIDVYQVNLRGLPIITEKSAALVHLAHLFSGYFSRPCSRYIV
jgi:hypothetical protein